MEGFGFGKAANRQGRETSNILIGVVRGISDIIEQSSKKRKLKAAIDDLPMQKCLHHRQRLHLRFG